MKKGDKVRVKVGQGYADKLLVGSIHTVYTVDNNRVYLLKDEWWHIDRFELVASGLEAELELARSFVGKKVTRKDGNSSFVVNSAHVVIAESSRDVNASSLVVDEVAKHGYCVYVMGKNNHNLEIQIPLYNVDLYKDMEVEIQLNDDYKAIVTKKEIKVGCQTFDPSVVEQLAAALKRCNEQ